MADIDVRRDRGRVWPWVSLAVLVGLAAWGAWEALAGGGAEAEPAAAAPAPAAAPEPVPAIPAEPLAPTAVVVVDPVQVSEAMAAYAAHVGSDVPGDERHRYSAVGIGRLGAALAAVVGREPGPDPGVVAKVNAFYLIANLLVASPDSLRLHADWMRRAAVADVDAMEQVGETRFPGAPGLRDELAQARRAAEAIDADRGLATQTEEVRRFFREAEDPLRTLAERASAGAAGS